MPFQASSIWSPFLHRNDRRESVPRWTRSLFAQSLHRECLGSRWSTLVIIISGPRMSWGKDIESKTKIIRKRNNANFYSCMFDLERYVRWADFQLKKSFFPYVCLEPFPLSPQNFRHIAGPHWCVIRREKVSHWSEFPRQWTLSSNTCLS